MMEFAGVMRRTKQFVAMLAALMVPAAARSTPVYVDLGTAVPPAALGPYSMLPFDTVPQAALPDYTDTSTIPGSPVPGDLRIIDSGGIVNKRAVPASWPSWSHGYTGPVFFRGDTFVNILLPPNTKAFYFYAQPKDQSSPITLYAGSDDGSCHTSTFGTIVGPVTVGNSDAVGFGFYETGEGLYLRRISVYGVASSANGFAIGEFGIAALPGVSADLTVIGYAGPNPATVGHPLTYSFWVANDGPDGATALTLTDTLPPSVTFVSATATQGTCSESGGIVTCDLGTLGSCVWVDVEIVVSPNQTGTIVNTAALSANETDLHPADNSSTIQTTATDGTIGNGAYADLGLTASAGSSPATLGSELTYTLNVRNDGPDSATDVVVRDTLPSTATFVSSASGQGTCAESGGIVTCDLGTLQSGQETTIEIGVLPTQAGPIASSAIASSNQQDPVPGNDMASVESIVIVDGLADLTGQWQSVRKRGATYSFNVEIENPGTVKSGHFFVKIYFSHKGRLDPKAKLVAALDIPDLPPGGRYASRLIKYSLPQGQRRGYLIMQIDSEKEVTESDEAHNVVVRKMW